MTKWILIAAGGALGSVLRYAVSGWVHRLAGNDVGFPVGTMAVNVIGCFVIGLVAAAIAGPFLLREEYSVGLTIGVLGGFTTFSTFGLETFKLATAGQLLFALANVVLSCGFGLIAVWIGYRLAQHWFGA